MFWSVILLSVFITGVPVYEIMPTQKVKQKFSKLTTLMGQPSRFGLTTNASETPETTPLEIRLLKLQMLCMLIENVIE